MTSFGLWNLGSRSLEFTLQRAEVFYNALR